MLDYNYVVRVYDYQAILKSYKVKNIFSTKTSPTFFPSFLKEVAFLTPGILATLHKHYPSIRKFPGGFE